MRAIALSIAVAGLVALAASSSPAAPLKDRHCTVKMQFVQRVPRFDKKGRFSSKLEPVPFATWRIVGADTRLQRGLGLTDAGGRATVPVDVYEYTTGEPKSAGEGKDGEVYIVLTDYATVAKVTYDYGKLTLDGKGGSGDVGPVLCIPSDAPNGNFGRVQVNGQPVVQEGAEGEFMTPVAPLVLPKPPKAKATPKRGKSGTKFRVGAGNFKAHDRILVLERMPSGQARQLTRSANAQGSVSLIIGGPQPPGAYAWCFLSRTNHSEACAQYVVT